MYFAQKNENAHTQRREGDRDIQTFYNTDISIVLRNGPFLGTYNY